MAVSAILLIQRSTRTDLLPTSSELPVARYRTAGATVTGHGLASLSWVVNPSLPAG
jgi:hypothetical protein